MKKFTNALLAASVIATAVTANSAITAVKVSSNIDSVTNSSSVWDSAKFSKVTLYPQTTIKLNDKIANELNANNTAVMAEVAAVYNDTNIAFIIKWEDGTKSIQESHKTDSYSDGFAVQFASDYKNPKELPYIGMGSEGRPVVVHLQKDAGSTFEPNGKGDVYYQVNPNQTNLFEGKLEEYNKQVSKIASTDYERTFVSEGFRSMTEIKDGSSKSSSTITYEEPGFFSSAKAAWNGTLTRELKDEYLNLDSRVIPVAFAVWDGAKLGRNGLKNLSGWTAVILEDKKGSQDLVSALNADVKGDIVKGKAAVADNCTACHQTTSTDAPNLMGPSLTNIGGYATADYIRESLVNPSAVVVPGYNRNAHSNYAWYNVENGKRVSTMPEFTWLEPKQLDDIIAYLKTLKAEVK